MSSFLPSAVALGSALLAAIWLTVSRSSPNEFGLERLRASRALALTTAVQAVHFAEEWATAFHVEFPALFGLAPLPVSFFVAFNLAWILFWVLSIAWVRGARRLGFFAAWFLAIAGVLNGLAHPAMGVLREGYFPGLLTSPLLGLAALLLWQRLLAATKPQRI
jgi:hypothetical protein